MKKILIIILILILPWWYYTDIAYADSNKENRANVDIFVESTVGWHVPTLLAIPIKLGYYESPNLLFGIEQGKREFEYDDKSVVVDNGKIENTGAFVRYFYPFFNSDSLNFLASFNKRNFEVDVRVRVDDILNTPFGGDTKYTNSNLKTETYTLSLGIGNQWLWSCGIYLNVDWYMPTFILHSESKSSISSDGVNKLSVDENKRVENDLNDFGKTINNIAGSDGYLMITAGFAF